MLRRFLSDSAVSVSLAAFMTSPSVTLLPTSPKPTVSIGVTCAVAYTYGCDDGRIAPTRCAIIAAGLDGRESPCLAYKNRTICICLTPVKLTVCLDVTSLVVCSYGCDDGRIGPTRCALIDAALDDRWRIPQASRTSLAAIRSARSGLVGGSRLVSTAAPGAFR